MAESSSVGATTTTTTSCASSEPKPFSGPGQPLEVDDLGVSLVEILDPATPHVPEPLTEALHGNIRFIGRSEQLLPGTDSLDVPHQLRRDSLPAPRWIH